MCKWSRSEVYWIQAWLRSMDVKKPFRSFPCIQTWRKDVFIRVNPGISHTECFCWLLSGLPLGFQLQWGKHLHPTGDSGLKHLSKTIVECLQPENIPLTCLQILLDNTESREDHLLERKKTALWWFKQPIQPWNTLRRRNFHLFHILHSLKLELHLWWAHSMNTIFKSWKLTAEMLPLPFA